MTLQECFDKNDKEGFLVLAWDLCSLRKISHHEYSDLKFVHDHWKYGSQPVRRLRTGI